MVLGFEVAVRTRSMSGPINEVIFVYRGGALITASEVFKFVGNVEMIKSGLPRARKVGIADLANIVKYPEWCVVVTTVTVEHIWEMLCLIAFIIVFFATGLPRVWLEPKMVLAAARPPAMFGALKLPTEL